MNRIDQTFASLKERREKALIGYLTAGYPTAQTFEKLVPELVLAGLDILEIGIPFSDPIADGPVIQQASQKALDQGVTLNWIFETTRRLREKVSIPFIYMSYCNPIYAMGIDQFFARAQECGADGIIIPDLIPEVGEPYETAAAKHGIHLIYLAAPTTPTHRLSLIAKKTRGFLYVVSLTGVTGTRTELPKDLGPFISKVRRASRTPVAVGFGVSTPEHARTLAPLADGVIVGSALIKAVSDPDRFADARSFISSLKKELVHAS